MIRPMIKAKMIPIQPKRNTRNAASWYMGIAFLIKSKSIVNLLSFIAYLQLLIICSQIKILPGTFRKKR